MSEKTPREQIALLKNVIEDLQERVQTASESIDAIVQTLDEQHDEAAQPDFERLRYESEKQAYEGHPAARSTMPELYFLLLVSVLTAADATQAQWRHLYRTAAGAGYEADVRDLLPDAYSLTDAKLIEAVESIKRDELTNAFVLDCILLALLQEGDAAALLAYIADLFALLGAEKEVVSETMQAAKTIVAQDREAYLAAMADMAYLDAQESCCYLFHSDIISVMNDLVQPKAVTSKHLIIVGVKETNNLLDLDNWKAEKITFRDCIFENSALSSWEKEVTLIECTFYGKGDTVGEIYLFLKKSSTLRQCTFKNLSTSCGLCLYNAEITHCTFSNCSVRSCNLINLSTGTITDSKFIHCYNDDNYYLFCISGASIARCNFSDCFGQSASLLKLSDSTITESDFIRCHLDEDNGRFCEKHLIFISKTSIMQCTFSQCKTIFSSTGSNAVIIYAENNSTIEHCHFEQCKTEAWRSSRYIIYIKQSTQTNNIFQECSCERQVLSL